jgi:hypothetical protein
MGAQDRLGLGRPGRVEQGTLVGHPAMELAPADRPAAQLRCHLHRALVAHLGHQPQPALTHPERVLGPRLEAERGIERHHLGPTGGAAEPPAAESDLAREGHQQP